MIRFEDVTKQYGKDTAAVRDLDLEMAAGQLTVLVGPSGCGKTTSLRMINRMEDPTRGRVLVDGRDVHRFDRRKLRLGIGYVMQSAGLFPHRKIRDNIATIPHLLGWSRARINARIEELVELVGLRPEILSRYPHALSGGQQQRVGVARALAADPPVLLMDEPFGAVDPVVRTHLQNEFLHLQARMHKTIVFVTHDIEEAIRLGDRIAIFRDGGRLAQYASPSDLLAAPADDFVRDFLGEDRELRRLALIPAGRIPPESGPVVRLDGTTTAAREAAQAAGTNWVTILDAAQRPLGWVHVDQLGDSGVQQDDLHRFPHLIRNRDSLRSAVNAMVATDIDAAPRVDAHGRYTGLVTRASLRGMLR